MIKEKVAYIDIRSLDTLTVYLENRYDFDTVAYHFAYCKSKRKKIEILKDGSVLIINIEDYFTREYFELFFTEDDNSNLVLKDFTRELLDADNPVRITGNLDYKFCCEIKKNAKLEILIFKSLNHMIQEDAWLKDWLIKQMEFDRFCDYCLGENFKNLGPDGEIMDYKGTQVLY